MKSKRHHNGTAKTASKSLSEVVPFMDDSHKLERKTFIESHGENISVHTGKKFLDRIVTPAKVVK